MSVPVAIQTRILLALKSLSESSMSCNTDKTVAALAKKHGVSEKDLEAQLTKGIQVEKEHTDDEKCAAKIALDHLEEDPKYYDKLQKVEEEAPVNCVGGGNIAGIGPGQVPPVKLKKRKIFPR